jgi:hypothetical protein
MQRGTFFFAAATGMEVEIVEACSPHSRWKGRIMGYRMESGFEPGQRPKHLLVSLYSDRHKMVIDDLYVRLED